MTINELLEFCKEETRNGNGNKKIIICTENGLGFFPLTYCFSSVAGNSDNIYECLDDLGVTEGEVIVLN